MPKCMRLFVLVGLALQALAFAQPSAVPKSVPASTPTLSINTTPSASTSTTATRKARSNDIYRWVDSKGKVQYSADVPDDRLSTARKVDTRSNIISSRVPARISGAPPPSSPDGTPIARTPVTEREKCEAAWKKYNEAVACFANARQGTVRGRANKAGGNVAGSEESQCQSITEPAPCR